MSRPYYPVLNSLNQQGNFGVVSRTNRIDFVDYPQRTQAISAAVVPINYTGITTLTPTQVQTNTIILFATGASGSASSTFILPTAQALLESFNGMLVGRSVRLNIVNKGPQVASIFANPGNGQVLSTQTFSNQPVGATGGPTGQTGVIPFLQGVNVYPVGTTINSVVGGNSNLVGMSNFANSVGPGFGARPIDIEFVTINPSPLAGAVTQFIALGATGSYIVY